LNETFFLIVRVSIFWNCQSPKKESQNDNRKRIAFFGSSVCKNVGDGEGLGYAGRFAWRLNTLRWEMLRSSLELDAPLVTDSAGANFELEIRAQSLTKAEMKLKTKYGIIIKGMKKDL